MNKTLSISSSYLTANISTVGASLETLRFCHGPNLILHDESLHWRKSFAGSVVGPIANRVRDGQFSLGGKIHQMACNENGVTSLHSGPKGLSSLRWHVTRHEVQMIHFQRALKDGDCRMPGNRMFDVVYQVDGASLNLEIKATSDQPTPISVAHHPYWRLGNTSLHKLQINACEYLPVDQQKIPTGEILPVSNTIFDFRIPRAVNPIIDHNFCLSRCQLDAPIPVATLTSINGLTLHLDSTEPGLQVYAGALLPKLSKNKIGPLAGIALEPQGWPNAVNEIDFPSVIISPKKPYFQKTRYLIKQS